MVRQQRDQRDIQTAHGAEKWRASIPKEQTHFPERVLSAGTGILTQ